MKIQSSCRSRDQPGYVRPRRDVFAQCIEEFFVSQSEGFVGIDNEKSALELCVDK